MSCHAVGHGGWALDSIKWHLIVIKSNRTDLVAELEILIGITNGLPWYIQALPSKPSARSFFFFVRQQARHPVGGGDLLYTCTIAVLKYPRADSGPLYHLHGANVYYTPGHFPLSGPYVNT